MQIKSQLIDPLVSQETAIKLLRDWRKKEYLPLSFRRVEIGKKMPLPAIRISGKYKLAKGVEQTLVFDNQQERSLNCEYLLERGLLEVKDAD